MRPRPKEFSGACAPKLRPNHRDLPAAGLERFDGLPDDSPCGEGRALLAVKQWMRRPETEGLLDLFAALAHNDFRRSGIPFADEIDFDQFAEVWLNRRDISIEEADCRDYKERIRRGVG